MLILVEFLQRRQRLRALQKRIAARVENLQCLRDEFDFANAAAAQFDVAIEFAGFDDFVLDALFHRGNFLQSTFADERG